VWLQLTSACLLQFLQQKADGVGETMFVWGMIIALYSDLIADDKQADCPYRPRKFPSLTLPEHKVSMNFS
jgi:hypothetical protein